MPFGLASEIHWLTCACAQTVSPFAPYRRANSAGPPASATHCRIFAVRAVLASMPPCSPVVTMSVNSRNGIDEP